MSLGYTFVKLDDGKWYRGASLGEKDWFLCFDEDEPEEIVIKRKAFDKGLTFEKIIEKLGLNCDLMGKHHKSFMGRCFGMSNSNLKMHSAVARYARVYSPPSTKFLREYDEVYSVNPKREGTYIDFENVPKYINPLSKEESQILWLKNRYNGVCEVVTSPLVIPYLKVQVGKFIYTVCYLKRERVFKVHVPKNGNAEIIEIKIREEVLTWMQKFQIRGFDGY